MNKFDKQEVISFCVLFRLLKTPAQQWILESTYWKKFKLTSDRLFSFEMKMEITDILGTEKNRGPDR